MTTSRSAHPPVRPSALWGTGAPVDAQMLAYTVADDREIDARLIRWDILGTLGHLQGLPIRVGERREWRSRAHV